MSYSIIAIHQFKKALKKLAKKHLSLKSDLAGLLDTLEVEPMQGVALGDNCYKIRLSIKSKGRGKSGGARVIIYVAISENTVFLLTIFDKADKENISDKELKRLLEYVFNQ